MLRPKRMSKVSVTGSKPVMDDVIEAVHGLNLVHLSEYDGRWDGFDNGTPLEGGDEASENLVTVRALKSILGVTEDDAGPSRIVTDDLEDQLEEVRREANELDDRREAVRNDLTEIEEQVDGMEPFAKLGIDLDLLWGYDSLSVAVGEGDPEAVEAALAGLDCATEVFAEDDVVAAVAHTDADRLNDTLVEAEFAAVEVPHEEGDPEEYLAELEHRKQKLESKLETVEGELEDLRYDAAGFLLAAEEELAIEARKAEAPLSFATTENAFVAEGWIPTERYDEFEAAVADAVGDHADIEELEVAAYDRHGHAETHEEVRDEGEATGTVEAPAATAGEAAEASDGPDADDEAAEPVEATADGGGEVRSDGGEASTASRPSSEPRSDGGVVTMGEDDPPVIQDNPGITKPFELLTKAVGRPNYSELDPTIVLFLTFPLMFGFMIGDVGYGLIYTGIGYWVYANFESDAFKNFGIVAAAAGAMTTVFGVLYGEIFGLHLVTEYLWVDAVGLKHAPIEKGLSPATSYWAEAWFVLTALFGLLHLNVAYVFEFVENRSLHGTREAVIESGSWLLAFNGMWLFIFSDFLRDSKPDLLFEVFDSGEGAAFALGFSGFPAEVGMVGVGMLAVGMALLVFGPAYELIELHITLAHTLSYLRIAAVLLAKAGMAFAVNLLFFGAYQEKGEFHFMLSHGPEYVLEHHEEATIMFPGMIHGGVGLLAFGVVVLLVGHLVVLLLGITSAGIQSIRLEYFEFFSKFYEGSGRVYSPFGAERSHTEDGS